MWARLVPFCDQWCITWQLTDEALTFYSWPCEQFSALWNCGGLHPLTLAPVNYDHVGGWKKKKKRNSDSDSESRRSGDESRMQIAGERGRWMPQNQRLPHDPSLWFRRTFHLIPSWSQLCSLIVFAVVCVFAFVCACAGGGLSGVYPQSVHTGMYGGVLPQAS